ncbi:MAG TPA: twin-arginine translocase TatA/TatE family subunit [Anaerolineae bacterium]|nr:twin-arginine translocase TatA/TatE family subunit [Anaerolineae bacterium]
MPQWIRGPELIIILVIVVLLFGVGRLSRIGSELGQGIREFRKELKGDDEGSEIQTEDED